MTKILIALLALAMTTSAVSAQQRTFYDASGKVVGRSFMTAVATSSAASPQAAARRASMMRAVA